MDLGVVRGGFERAGYTVAGVRELLGPVAGGALAREEVVPALRVTGGSGLGALVRLFWLQVPVAAGDVPEAAALVAAGLAERSGDELRAVLRVEPVEDASYAHAGWVVSDLKVRPGGRKPAGDHVVGAGGASANLARLVIHKSVEKVLDLGTGSGIQALHLAGRAARVTATDVNPRALELARMTLELSGAPEAELLQGSLFEPVRDRAYDLIVSNPPFVIAPPGGPRYTYREAGLAGDEFCRRLVTGAPAHLTEDGWCQLIGNWLHVEGEPWEERVASWVDGCDAWVVQRDVQDPAEYAELWLRDSVETGTPEYRARYDAWLDHFAEHKVTGIGFGWITLRRAAHTATRPAVRVEDLRHAVDQPVGAYVERILDAHRAATALTPSPPGGAEQRVTALAGAPGAAPADRAGDLPGAAAEGGLGGLVLRTVGGVVQEQIGAPGEEDPERIVLRQAGGLRRAAGVGTVEAALAGVCDGTLPLGPLLEAIAQLTGDPAETVRAHAAGVLPELIADGFFEVVRAP